MQRFTSERPRRRMMDAIAQPVAPDAFDPITGLATHEMFRRRAESEWQRRARAHGPMSVLRVEIDHFDACRTQQGVDACNERLRLVAEVVARSSRRRADFAGRLGDREIGVLLCETAPRGAEKVAKQIADDVARLGAAGADIPLTVSIGVASAIPRPNRFLESLMLLAEQGLKQAAAAGGNQSVSVREEK